MPLTETRDWYDRERVEVAAATFAVAWLIPVSAGAVDFPDVLKSLGKTNTPIYEIAIRLALALVFSLGVGVERETSRKPAGLRTHMMVSLASAAFTVLALEMMATGAVSEVEETMRTDPIRVIEAVIAGVAFLGAGTIIQARSNIVGITTGASIWMAGAIGLACGGGYYAIALLLVLFSVFTLAVVGAFERHVMRVEKKRHGAEKSPPRE